MKQFFYVICKVCANILLELASASLNANQLLERLRLSAEFLDMLIDLFGEDNMTDLEVSLNFIQRMSTFSDAFYANVSFYFVFISNGFL